MSCVIAIAVVVKCTDHQCGLVIRQSNGETRLIMWGFAIYIESNLFPNIFF
jgi:hypothetical protein